MASDLLMRAYVDSASCFEIAVGWGATSSPVPSAVGGMSPPFKTVVILTLRWAAMGIDPAAGGVRIGMHRASWPVGGVGMWPHCSTLYRGALGRLMRYLCKLLTDLLRVLAQIYLAAM